jgi:hypothetical protein
MHVRPWHWLRHLGWRAHWVTDRLLSAGQERCDEPLGQRQKYGAHDRRQQRNRNDYDEPTASVDRLRFRDDLGYFARIFSGRAHRVSKSAHWQNWLPFSTQTRLVVAGRRGNVATIRDGIAAACRRCALGSLALAAAAYRPVSYDDALAIRTLVAEALDVEITAAGDAGEDDVYLGLKTLRASVIADLTARGASLFLVETVTMPGNLPALVVADRLYEETSRSDQLVAETGVIHPAFMPTTMQVLAA